MVLKEPFPIFVACVSISGAEYWTLNAAKTGPRQGPDRDPLNIGIRHKAQTQ